MSRDVLAELNTNWVAWLESKTEHVPGGEFRWFGPIPAASVGVPIPLFNQVFVLEQPSEEDLAGATSWIRGRDVPHWITVAGPHVEAVAGMADAVGLARSDGAMPGMALASLAGLSPVSPSQLEVRPVTHADQLEAFAVVTADAFGPPLEEARRLDPPSMLEDDRMGWFVGFVDSEPAACGQLLRTRDVAGVYAIGVRERFRRRGIGEAITRAVLIAGRKQGCELGVLQASPMGTPVYERMGFETITEYHHFVAAP